MIIRSDGTTETEKWLISLAKKSFLSLWSYPNLYRKELINNSSRIVGNEICDLLVVFGNSVLIFSDKDCQYTPHDSEIVAWIRWYKSSIEKSYRQVLGAENWITNHSDRIYYDKECTEQVSFNFDKSKPIAIHRILVCHNVKTATKLAMKVEKDLYISTDIVEKAHYETPFKIGQIDARKGFAHVFDTEGIKCALEHLTTISDFLTYLECRAEIAKSGILRGTEKDILGSYFHDITDEGLHYIPVDSYGNSNVKTGSWDRWIHSFECAAKIEDDNANMLIDEIIEHFTKHVFAGSLIRTHPQTYTNVEVSLRAIASEDRFRRRCLSSALEDFMNRSKDGLIRRIPASKSASLNHYVFVCINKNDDEAYEDYRERRKYVLRKYCGIHRAQHPDSYPVVGFATEPKEKKYKGRSEDLYFFPDFNLLNEDERIECQENLQSYLDQNLDKLRVEHRQRVNEYRAADFTIIL